MKSFRFALALLLTSIVMPAHAAEPMTRAEVEKIVREYMIAHPEVIIESMQAMQEREMQKDAANAGKAVKENRAALVNDAASPVAGNPKGDVTLVQFFDYNCGYCKKMLPVINSLIGQDTNLRIVFKELPVLDPSSEVAARWALAVYVLDSGKYFAYHSALMTHPGALNEAFLSQAATKLDLDAAKVKAKANAAETGAELAKTHKLAQTLGIRGTPALIVGDELFPGAKSAESLQEKIKAARAGK